MNGYGFKFFTPRYAWIACMLWAVPVLSVAQDMTGMSMHDMPSVSSQPVSSPVLAPPGSMQSMDMHDDAPQTMFLVDQWEFADGYHGHGPMWDIEAWYGDDDNKLWLRSEGESSGGRIDDGDIEALWNHPVSAFWSTQLGVRHDLGLGPHRDWAALGIEGLAPYWIELEASAYASETGRIAARMRTEYTLRFTQRLLLQPEFEINLYGTNDPQQRIGSGVSDAQLGLRLRYEMTRQCAPYLGVVWTRRFGVTAGYAREDQMPVFDRQFVIGIRFWL